MSADRALSLAFFSMHDNADIDDFMSFTNIAFKMSYIVVSDQCPLLALSTVLFKQLHSIPAEYSNWSPLSCS
jgi:hypothetical protein